MTTKQTMSLSYGFRCVSILFETHRIVHVFFSSLSMCFTLHCKYPIFFENNDFIILPAAAADAICSGVSFVSPGLRFSFLSFLHSLSLHIRTHSRNNVICLIVTYMSFTLGYFIIALVATDRKNIKRLHSNAYVDVCLSF